MPVTPTPTLSGYNYCYQEVTINVINSGEIEYYDCSGNYYIEFVSGNSVTITGGCLNIETFNGLDAIIQIISGNTFCATPQPTLSPTPTPTVTLSPCNCISVSNRSDAYVNFTYTYCNSSVASITRILPLQTTRFCVKNYIPPAFYLTVTTIGSCTDSSSCNNVTTPTPTPSPTLTPSPTPGPTGPTPTPTISNYQCCSPQYDIPMIGNTFNVNGVNISVTSTDPTKFGVRSPSLSVIYLGCGLPDQRVTSLAMGWSQYSATTADFTLTFSQPVNNVKVRLINHSASYWESPWGHPLPYPHLEYVEFFEFTTDNRTPDLIPCYLCNAVVSGNTFQGYLDIPNQITLTNGTSVVTVNDSVPYTTLRIDGSILGANCNNYSLGTAFQLCGIGFISGSTTTPTPTLNPSPTPTPTKFISPTLTPSITDKPTPTPTITPTITPTKFISPTLTPSITDKPTPTPTLTDKPTLTPFSTPIPTSGATNVCKCVKTVTFDIISVNRFIPQKNRKIIYKDCCGNKQEFIIKQKTPINNYTIPCVNCNNLCFEVNSVYAENLTIRNIRYNENQLINCCNCIPLLTPIPTITPTITPARTPTPTPTPTPTRTSPPTPTPTSICNCKKFINLTPYNYEFAAFDCEGNYISGIWDIYEEKCIDISYGRVSGVSVNFVECCF